MSNNKNLIQELIDKKNLYLNDDSNFNLNKLYTNYIFSLFLITLLVGMIMMLIKQFYFFIDPFSFNDLASLTIGYTSLIYAVKLIKEKVILYFTYNPIIVIGIIYPYFFIVSLFNYISFNFFNLELLGVIMGILSIIINYLILNFFYKKYYK